MPPEKAPMFPDEPVAPDMITRAEAEAMARSAADAAVASALKMFSEMRGSPANNEDVSFARALATEISGLADQGTGKKRVPAEVLEKRLRAREKMVAALLKYRTMQLKPEYTLNSKVHIGHAIREPVWVDAHRVQHPTKIKFMGVPNEAMDPANGPAREVYKYFLESIGTAKGTVPMRIGVTAAGHVLEALPKLPKEYDGEEVEVEEDPLVPPSTPEVGYLEVVAGPQPGSGAGKTIERRILGTVAAPAKELVN